MAPYQTPGQTALERCREALRRIEAGLTLLPEDEQAAEAFRFANLAMWQQRVHTIVSLRRRRDEPVDERAIDVPANRSWYPFQLAFVLLNLPGITRLDHKDRSEDAEAVADLLWFPTGGGKTEAYLGLSAYTMGLRRLQGPVAGRSGEQGVAVLMRYTLRLLTIQQFQRATALICACEVIRRGDEKKWGKEPFRIGLWVGQKTTPNTTDQAAEAIQQEHGGKYKGRGSGSPAQLTNCPWCGSKIDPGRDIKVEVYAKGRCRTVSSCGDVLGPLPVQRQELAAGGHPGRRGGRGDLPPPADPADRHGGQVRPDAVERQGPDALRPGRRATAPATGSARPRSRTPTRHPKKDKHPPAKTTAHPLLRPPDLIIQDELHLISRAAGDARGPLRDGGGQALLVGGGRQDGPAQADRLDGDDPQGRGPGPRHVPAGRAGSSRRTASTCGTTSSPSSGPRARTCPVAATSASAPPAAGSRSP